MWIEVDVITVEKGAEAEQKIETTTGEMTGKEWMILTAAGGGVETTMALMMVEEMILVTVTR